MEESRKRKAMERNGRGEHNLQCTCCSISAFRSEDTIDPLGPLLSDRITQDRGYVTPDSTHAFGTDSKPGLHERTKGLDPVS